MLLGSIPFGHIALRLRGRTKGPVPGPEGTLQALGFGWMTIVLILNAAKGFVPVYFAKAGLGSETIIAIAGAFAVLSHCFPYWLMFRLAGKGTSVGFGVLLALSPIAGLCAFVMWIAILLAHDRVSVASMVAALSAPVWCIIFRLPHPYLWLSLGACAFILAMHWSNLTKIGDGTEPRLRHGKE